MADDVDPEWRARRLRYSGWRRLVRWEFWPTLPIYLPLAPVFFWCAVRYRSLMVATVVNPGMPSGGFVDDSKSDILEKLRPSGRIADFLVISDTLDAGEQEVLLDGFLAKLEKPYPVVLKPEMGERGRGVLIARSREECLEYLRAAECSTILQEHVAGVEYGVFYERAPEEEKGKITGITLKGKTEVTGDGKSSLEKLILGDERAVCLAPLFLEMHAESLERVLEEGEVFALNKLGTHSQGSLFLDAGDLWTEELEEAVDEASRHFEGFYLGRYDVRVASAEEFQRGEGWKIVELNGVTSEPTHMYDPKHSVWYAWKTLAAQWCRAYRYGAQNRARGHEPLSLATLWKRVREHSARL